MYNINTCFIHFVNMESRFMFLVQQILNLLQNLAKNDSMIGLQKTFEIIDITS